MLGLKIDSLKISVNTNGGCFSTFIRFSEGLNVIRAENSSGKSTCINAIAYGLGLEAILGPRRKKTFPKSLHKEIFDNKVNQNPYFVSSSFVVLTVRNSHGQTAKLRREILGHENKIAVQVNGKEHDYFLGSAGQVGSAVSERGFHHWLADFIGWELPNVITYDGNEVKLYLECIFPLFFIEQKRGWSEIQANIPTHYGIKNVKKAAMEFCLAVDSFELEKKITRNKNRIEKAESDWGKIISVSESVAEFNSVQMSQIPPIGKYQNSSNIEFYYLEGEVKISVSEQERSTKRLREKLSKNIEKSVPDNEELSTQLTILRNLRRKIEKNAESIEIAIIAASETESKLFVLKQDLLQYQQLKRLKRVGSKIDADLDTQKCPICESDLYDTLGNRTAKRQPMTLEENIDFLESQVDFFTRVKNKNIHQLQELQAESRFLNSKLNLESEKCDGIREDINDINGATKALLREKIQTEIKLREVVKLKELLEKQRAKASKVHNEWTVATNSLKQLRKESSAEDKMSVIHKLEAIIKANLSSFGFDPSAVNSISISPQTFRPEQEGYDIVAETSASDYIRIIWSYTLALMQLAGEEESIKHGGFVVFDEPRQHETSKISFAKLIEKASGTSTYQGQVIFATSMDESELQPVCDKGNVNLVRFSDYMLTLESEPKK